MHLLRVVGLFLRIGVLNELQYRVNFFLQLLQSLIALATGLVGLALVFRQTNELAGWSQPELLVVMGVHILTGSLIQTLIEPNMIRIATEIEDGNFDYLLVRPIDSQLLASVREIRMWSGVNALVGIGVIIVALIQLQRTISLWEGLAFLIALICGAVMIYCFWLMLTMIAFWAVRIDNMLNLFDGVFAAGRWPVTVYPTWLQGILTFLVPVAFAVTIPATAVTGRLDSSALALAGSLALGLALLARFLWRFALRHYSGASA